MQRVLRVGVNVSQMSSELSQNTRRANMLVVHNKLLYMIAKKAVFRPARLPSLGRELPWFNELSAMTAAWLRR